jgi:hypothetical protein
VHLMIGGDADIAALWAAVTEGALLVGWDGWFWRASAGRSEGCCLRCSRPGGPGQHKELLW